MKSKSYIDAICVSDTKGTVKTPIKKAMFVKGHGIQGDAHAGNWHRQVSLLAGESIDRMKRKMPEINRGAFAENIITRNLDTKSIKVGCILCVGREILLKVIQIGKDCHHGCAIKQKTGECIMPAEGIFAEVIQGGSAKPGDPIKIFTCP